MIRRAAHFLFAFLLTTMSGFAAFALADEPTSPRNSFEGQVAISVTAFSSRVPNGYLGVPLGTIVRVTGVAIDGDKTKMKANAGETLLRIETVNGKKLDQAVDFVFYRAREVVKKPVPDERFDYYVHEYGEFDGVVTLPKELGVETVAIANDGFYYRRHVTVHAANKVQQ